VRVGTERFNLDLPMPARLGQTVEMTFVSSDPRSTFAIARQAGSTPPVTISDASRLLSLLISSEQIIDPELRSSLQSIGSMLRSSSGEAAVLANLLDEALIYGSRQEGSRGGPVTIPPTPNQERTGTFESNAARILGNIAQNSRFTLIEAANHPVTPLPLLPGEEVNATVVGALPGGKTFVQVAGTALELMLPRQVMPGEILRLTYLAAEPKPTFALSRTIPETHPPVLSEAGRWLSVLEHSDGGLSRQQVYVLERLNTVLKSLPPNSPAFSAISDDALTYQRSTRPPGLPTDTPPGTPLIPSSTGNGIVLSDDMAKLLQAVIRGNRLVMLEALSQQAPGASFLPGQQLKGEVLAALGGGRFTVQVAGQALEFAMPKGVRRGDLITLFFITDEPHQTFLMARFGKGGDSIVSGTGRWLSAFLSESTSSQATLAIMRTLLAEPTTDASLLGRTLQQGLRESGLFYESHLARWFGGDFPLEDLLKEPQGRLSSRLPQTIGATADGVVPAGLRDGSTELIEALLTKTGAGVAHEGIADQRALATVCDQLSALQNGQLLFRGELFPGQQLEWSVTERDAGRNQSGGRERNWETGITVTLPHLGMVTARLTLDGSNIAVTISAENGGTVPILAEGRGRLIEQLEGAGLTPAELSIHHAA
jgi:hypothetical protein